MDINAHHPDDLATLTQRVRTERHAKTHDRCRCVLLAIEGLAAPDIAQEEFSSIPGVIP